MTRFVFDVVLIGFHVSATQRGFSLRNANRVKHSITVKDVVGPTRDELWVWAVSDISTVEARREGALDDVAFCWR
jgi:hypothetical protein